MAMDEVLRKQTFKDDVPELEKRVFYTLTDKKDLQVHRIAKALSLAIKALREKQVFSDDEIDELLLKCVGGAD